MPEETGIRPAQPHGRIREIFDDVWFVTGTFRIPGPPPMSFSRNMTIVGDNGRLTLINTLRLDEPGLEQLDKLGRVTDVIRLAAFHGTDDPFYSQHYGARAWSVNAPYAKGLTRDPRPEDLFFEPDVIIGESTTLPLDGASVIEITSATPCEALLYLDRHGGLLVSGDCLQNWHGPDEFFNLPGRIVMRLMGFFRPYNVGPSWRKGTRPDAQEIRAKLNVEFEHVLPAHGEPAIGGAKTNYAPALDRLQGG